MSIMPRPMMRSRTHRTCALSECLGAGGLHSTHGVHPEAPCRDIFRLSNDPNHGFNSVGPEWHNDGSFCREVFGHVVYHIVKAPSGAGSLCVVFVARCKLHYLQIKRYPYI